MNDTVRQFRDFFVSLKLTVVLLVLGLLLVFFATLDQVNLGIWAIQQKWFRSFFVLQDFKGIPIPVFPGGYFIGGLLLINLISAHVYRFKLTWRKAGIFLTHIGFILLLIGELLSGVWQQDYSMRIKEGQTVNYAEHFHDDELAIIDVTDAAFDQVVAIPKPRLRSGETITHPNLPFRITTKLFYPNSSARPRDQVENPPPPLATTGPIAERFVVMPEPMTYKQNARNVPAVVVDVATPDGPIGSWLATSAVPALRTAPNGKPEWILVEPQPQRFEHAGRTWEISLRAVRSYKPFALHLIDFSHDRYAGTNIPKNYSALVRIVAPDGRDDHEVKIYMNNPLRHGGFTFYQASFDGEDTTVLQVVRNPSWLMPYIACAIMSAGLLFQFTLHLVGFARKRHTVRPAAA